MKLSPFKIKVILFSMFTLSVFTGCKYDLIDSPTLDKKASKSLADYKDVILPPTKVEASQGTYRSVNLSWDKVENAVQYQIYSAKTAFNTFEQIAETKGTETEITVEVDSGYTYCFAICAVNYFGTVSSKSKIVKGSALAIPIITDIEPSIDAKSVTINWWMDNCTSDTYADNLDFTVYTYTQGKALLPLYTTTVDGYSRTAKVSGLTPNTNYLFSVEAKLKNSNQRTETSDLTDKATAHSIVPTAVSDFKTTQGISSEYVELSWKLPEGADYYNAITNEYPVHSVMFDIQRKLKGSDDSAYVTIETIGTADNSKTYEHCKPLTATFDCVTQTTSSALLTVKKSEDHAALDLYPNYIPESILTYKDTSAERGRQYTYRIISYTDDTSKKMSEDTSITTPEDGWKIAALRFKANCNYDKDLTTEEYTAATVSFDFSFTPFSTTYNYIITRTITPFETAENPNPTEGQEKLIAISDSASSLNTRTDFYDFVNSEIETGYYKYRIYIVSTNISDIPANNSEYYETLASTGTIIITKDAAQLPTISNFTVKDGYSNKFILSWDYDEKYSYKVEWTPYINDIQLAAQSYIIPADQIKLNNDKTIATYEHPADSGDVRTYTLYADNGFVTSQTYESEENENEKQPIICKTLGTAVPYMTEYDYSKITVSWQKVQMADGYEISAEYINSTESYDDAAAALGELTDNNVTYTEEDDILTYVIDKPKGFNKADISGLPIKFKVTAKNNTTNDSTNGNATVKTLGPALTMPEVNKSPAKDYLSFSWNKIEGAEKYLIYRTMYLKNNTEITATDTYIYDAVNNTIIENDGQEINGRATVTLINNVFTLKDIQTDATEEYGYHLNQEKIQWGTPYGYVVLPLRSDYTKNNYKFNEKSLKLTEDSIVDFGTLKDIQTSTYGYGLNLIASKATSASGVVIKWSKPNNKNLIPTVYRKKFNKNADYDYGNEWEFVETLTEDAISYQNKLAKEELSSAYMYAVQYAAPNKSDFVASYRKEIEQLDNDPENGKSPTEQKNKGYLLTLDLFNASYGGVNTTAGDSSYYQENVTWNNEWDYEERALGPDSFTIDIKNKNIASTANWSTVASIIINKTNNNVTITPKTSYEDTTINSLGSNNGITLKPTGLTNGTKTSTTDILQVLRDAKHYYSVNLTRGTTTVRQAEDESIYAYRQISDEEFCKCVSLIIADSIYKAGIPNRKTYPLSGSSGTFYLACSTGTTDANRVQWYFTNYVNNFTNGASSANSAIMASFLTLNSNTSSFDSKGIYGETLYYLPELDITVSSDIKLSSYSGKVTFTAGGCDWSIFSTPSNLKHNLKISVNNKTVINISNNSSEMYNYFPYDLGTKHASSDSSLNTNLKTYQSPWWN